MNPRKLCAELRELRKNRRAIDIIADRHGCKYTDIILLIGATDEFERFDRRHPGKGGVGHAAPKREFAEEETSEIIRMRDSGMTYVDIGAHFNRNKSTVRAAYIRAKKGR